MEFQISKQASRPGAVTIIIVATFTPEEAAALTHFKAWEMKCTSEFNSPTFRELVEPGIHIPDCVPIYADYFQSRFSTTHGRTIQLNLSPIIDQFRLEIHRELEGDRDEYYGIKRLVPIRTFLPKKD